MKATNKTWRMRDVTVLGALLLVLALGVGVAESFYERSQAEKLIEVLSNIDLVYTTQNQAVDLTKRFSRYKSAREYVTRGAATEYDHFDFENRFFSILHLAPRKNLWIMIGYKNGLVAEKFVQYYEEPHCSGVVSETLRKVGFDDPLLSKRINGRYFYVGASVPNSDFIMKVDDNESVSLVRRRLDWQIDLHCLTAMGGCRDPRRVFRGAMR